MLFHDPVFIFIFLPVTLLLYLVIGRFAGRKYAFAWLVGASFFYYGYWKPEYIFLLVSSILVNYFFGLLLAEERPQRTRKILLTVGVAFNLALISYFKYAGFLAGKIEPLIGMDIPLPPIVLPLAISFFTFQQIAYLADAYHGEAREYNFIDYCLFVTFFPQLIAGPIVHHKEMLPQFGRRGTYRFRPSDYSIGLTIFAIGLFKKIVIADTMAMQSTPIFEKAISGLQPTQAEAWSGTLAYTFQIYFDFSGYSDMAIGIARLFGIRLPLNFHSPYKATSIIDFWRRWHMTLSRWLRDYLYIPLGGNRKGKTRRYVNLMITMLLGGLWHGASDTFIVWGGLHGVYLCVNHVWRGLRKKMGTDVDKELPWWGKAIAIPFTFFWVVVAWVFFRAESMPASTRMFAGMAGRNQENAITSVGVTPDFWWLAGIALAIAWFLPNTQQIMARTEPALEYTEDQPRTPGKATTAAWLTWKPNVWWALIAALLFFFSILYLDRPSEFIYYQF